MIGGCDGNRYVIRFKILVIEKINNYALMTVDYPSCTNYEGLKTLLVEMNGVDIEAVSTLDPHFIEDDARVFRLLARFEPTGKGWSIGLTALKRLALFYK